MRNVFCFFCYTLLLFNGLHGQGGLQVDYFDGSNFDRYVTTRTEPKIDMAWNDQAPVAGIDPHNCTLKFTGFLRAPETGVYTFSLKVDDGARVFIGDINIINAWNLNDNGDFKGNIKLEAGKNYTLRVEYFNALVEAEIKLFWVLPSRQKDGNFFHGPTPQIIDYHYFNPNVEQLIAHTSQPQQAPKNQVKPKVKPTPAPAKKPAPKAAPRVEDDEPNRMEAIEIAQDTVKRYIPKNVHFAQSEAVILEESKPGLDQLAQLLLRYKGVKLSIEGHTDVIGDDKVNLVLSKERAQAVKDYLVTKGIAASRMRSEGFGSTRPIYKASKNVGDSRNRRVEFIME